MGNCYSPKQGQKIEGSLSIKPPQKKIDQGYEKPDMEENIISTMPPSNLPIGEPINEPRKIVQTVDGTFECL